jgi:hypothetical protein
MGTAIRKRRTSMNSISVRRSGFAAGTTAALLYLGCVAVMAIVGRQGTIFLFNGLLHGLDVSPILRLQVPVWEVAMGFVETFILGWLVGATIASIYSCGPAKACCRE